MIRTVAGVVAALVMTACDQTEKAEVGAFESALQGLCGKAFEGRVISTDPQDDAWRTETLVMHVKDCEAGAYRIPLSVGEDRSRTWVLTRTGPDGAWELRHEHRHEDGEFDALTGYGGFARTAPGAARQEFPTDQATRDLFDAEGIPVSKTNVWAVEASPERFVYELSREGRFFRAEFDLTAPPVDTPPAHWGAEE